MTDIILDGLDFSALPYGAEASVHTLTGWFDSPEPKKQSVARLGRSGDFPASKVLYESRYIEVGANIYAPDHDALHLIGARLTGILQREGSLRVNGHGPSTWQWVERESAVRFTPITDQLAKFSVTLKAPDVRRLGVRQEFVANPGTAVEAYHNGNAYASPVVTVTGSYPWGFTVYGSATEPFTYTDSIWHEFGDTVSINFGTGVVIKNGSLAPGGSVGRSFLTEIPPFGETQRMNVIPHDEAAWGSYRVNVYDSWI